MNGLNRKPMTAKEAVAAIMGTALAIQSLYSGQRLYKMTQGIIEYACVIIDECFPEMKADAEQGEQLCREDRMHRG